MAQFIKLVFVQLIDVLHTEDHTVAHAAMRSAAAIATLSLDTVDEYVGELLQACGELKTSCREDIELARRNLVSSLIVTYARTRSLPFLMERLARPTPDTCILAAYAPVLRHCDVQKILASTVHALPHGQAVSCVSALIPSCLETPHAPCLSFLIALILETSEASQQAAVVREACSSVLPKIASLPVSVKIQSSAAFLLSSVLFALIRVDIPLDDEILKIIIESGIVQATGTLTFPREEVNESMFAIRLVESISHMGLVEDESLCFCIIRLLAVIAHFMVRQSVQDVNRDLMGKAFDEIFKRYEALISLCTGKNPKLHDSLFHGPSILDSTIPVIGSIIDMLHFTPTLKDVSSGFVMFISYAAEHFQPGHLLWQDLIERKFVQNSFADAVCTSLSRYSKAETQSPYPSNKVEAILKLIQAIPRGYVLETDEERIALAICSLHNFLEERSKEEAVRALLGLRIPCLVKAEDIFRSSVERGPHDSFLAKLVKAIEVKRLPEKKGQRLICSLLVSWSDGSQLLGRASSLLANVDIMVQDSANEYVPSKSVKAYSPEKKVTKRVLKLLPDIKRTCAKALTESEEQMERVNGLRIAGSLMRLHASIEQEKGIILALPELFEQLRTASAAVLRDCFEIALSCCAKFLQNYDDSNGIKHEMMDASHFFLSSLWCNGHKPVYHHFLSQVERIFFLSRIMASSIYFLSNKNAGVRTIGVEALCDIGSFEDKDVVQELGLLILSQIESEEECFDSIGCSMSAEEANNVLADCKRIRARVLGCASILCGCRLRSEDKVVVLNEDKSFGHFKEVRLRRDLSGIRLKRDISSKIMLQVLQKCSLLLRVISSIRALSGEIQEARDRQIKKVRNVVWFCVRLCMQACETCFSRQVPYRFDNMDVQEMLVSLTGLLRCIPKGDKFSEVHEEEVLVRMTRVCKCIMQHHASVGRWGTSGLLGTILKRGVMLESCEVAKGVGDVFEEFGRIGSCAGQRHAREVVCAVLANASESVVGVSTVEFRRALAPGMMALVKSIGENAARGILARLGDGGREVLKQVWELYVGEYQYRGK